MKKLMILGGGINQKGLLQAAGDLKYYIVLCDKNPECVCKDMADRFYPIDIINEEEVYKVAVTENIDGIISNSEVVMEVVADIASRLHLTGNPKESIRILQDKSKFRAYQKKIGVFSPKSIIGEDTDEIIEKLSDFDFPVIIKPVQCSGTRGTTRIDAFDRTKMEKSIAMCLKYSRNNQCAVEEYVEMPSLLVLEGEIFVWNDTILWDGLYFTKRSAEYPMIPMTYMIPYHDTDEHISIIKEQITKIFSELPIHHGQYNIESYFSINDRFFVIEINARQGGHGLPGFVKRGTGIDMDKLLVSTAAGDPAVFDEYVNKPVAIKYETRHTVFSNKSGKFSGLYFDPEIEDYVKSVELEKNIGDSIEKATNGSSYLGFVNLTFPSYELQHHYGEDLERYIYPKVENDII